MRVPNLHVCEHLWIEGGTRWGRRANQRPAWLSARVIGHHVVRGRQSSPIPAQASSVSVAVRSQVRVTGKAGENGQCSGAGRQLTLDKTVGSRAWCHT